MLLVLLVDLPSILHINEIIACLRMHLNWTERHEVYKSFIEPIQCFHHPGLDIFWCKYTEVKCKEVNPGARHH